MVTPPKMFLIVSCDAKAKAIPPMPSVPISVVTVTPILCRAITMPIAHTIISTPRLISGMRCVLMFSLVVADPSRDVSKDSIRRAMTRAKSHVTLSVTSTSYALRKK